MLRFKTDDALPPALAAHARVTGRIVQVAAHDAGEVESMLARCAPPVRVEDLEIGRADLEDVFIEIMRGGTPRGRRHEACASPCEASRRHPRRHATLFYKEVLRFWKVSFQTVAAPVLTAVLYLLIFGHVLEGHVEVFGACATPAS